MRVRKKKAYNPAKFTREGARSSSRPLMPSRETLEQQLRQEAEVFRLKTSGYTKVAIAKSMGIDARTVARIWERAFQEFIIDHRKLREEKFAEVLAGHERMIAAWIDAAESGDPKAADIVTKARAAISKMCGHGNNHQIEHSGLPATTITTVNATPMEAARLVREAFGGKAAPFDPATNGSGSKN